ncbi:PTS sugar transporter subunit IIA [Jeotgalibaca ciconiae]|uniref:PTS sugar transporter subunit IIA n=1 Tax=Jeotgalibaca ciconiae TaxID=2496265 RepID=A0A3S9HDY6_9LACT|nr:PTS sugar transporter subunit IIA [Jeotgalibaca ciconiae]AZP05587.1 PTS sugar transporter subunit IIA [Jeotgalibaca ciconiae]
MIGILITGHGEFSLGINDALEMIAGKQEGVKFVPFFKNESTDMFESKLKDTVLAMKKEYKSVIVLADLVGGTPFKTAVTILEKEVDFRVIGGINLPLVIELSMLRSTTNDIEELLEQLLITSQEAISEFKQVNEKEEFETELLEGI